MRRAWLLSLALAVALPLACKRDSAPRVDPSIAPLSSPGAVGSPARTEPAPGEARNAEAPASRPFIPESEPEAAPPSGDVARDVTDAEGAVNGPFIIDSLVDVAAAGPATANERGVAMVNRLNELWLARIDPAAERGSAPRETPLAALPDHAGPFPLGRGPAVRQGFAYWVSRGRLLRQRLSAAGPGKLPEVLAEDARVGTRAATPVGPESALSDLPQMAAYVVRPKAADAPLTAHLWVEGRAAPLLLTDDTASAHSVALLATARGVFALFLEARTGMSTIHLRRVEFPKGAEPSLGEDQVVWVGGPSRPSTELFADSADSADAVSLFMTLERDATHFGLALLRVGLDAAHEPPEPSWTLYENGIEPAPVASSRACGRAVLALARPASAVPHAPQELVLIDRDSPADAAVVARSKAFFDVSLSPLGRGALLVYVADHRTWARRVRCAA